MSAHPLAKDCQLPIAHCPLHRATFVREDERGAFIEVINSGPWETVITGSMREGAVMGNHYHKKTRVFFFLTDGAASVELVHVESGARRSRTLESRQGLFLEANEAHAIRFRRDSRFLLLKSRGYSEDDPDTFPHRVTASIA